MADKINLQEYIHKKMDILFLALNAPEISNSKAHWFSGTLSFWNVLYYAGLTTRMIFNPEKGDEAIFGGNEINYNHWVYGVTDLNREIVMTDSSRVDTNMNQVNRILGIIEENEVSKLCIMHSKVAQEFESAGLIKRSSGYGEVGKYNETIIYEVPFHNASIPDKHKYYALLKCDDAPNGDRQIIKERNIEINKPEITFAGGPTIKEKPTSIDISFALPSFGNEITANDVKKGDLRITADFKSHFPPNDQLVTVIFNDQEYQVRFVNRGSRSHLLKLGGELMRKIVIKAGSCVELRKTNNYTYIISLKK
jgi:hypothetical protein